MELILAIEFLEMQEIIMIYKDKVVESHEDLLQSLMKTNKHVYEKVQIEFSNFLMENEFERIYINQLK